MASWICIRVEANAALKQWKKLSIILIWLEEGKHLMEVEGDEGVHADAEVVVHKDGSFGEAKLQLSTRHHVNFPTVQLDNPTFF